MPPQNRVRKKTSFMPVKPLQTAWAKPKRSREAVAMPMMPATKMPMVSTRNTFMPIRARMRTSR